MSYCKNCGKELPVNAAFCSRCGMKCGKTSADETGENAVVVSGVSYIVHNNI
jgi:uncharacterized membrane protein YvbJ